MEEFTPALVKNMLREHLENKLKYLRFKPNTYKEYNKTKYYLALLEEYDFLPIKVTPKEKGEING